MSAGIVPAANVDEATDDMLSLPRSYSFRTASSRIPRCVPPEVDAAEEVYKGEKEEGGEVHGKGRMREEIRCQQQRRCRRSRRRQRRTGYMGATNQSILTITTKKSPCPDGDRHPGRSYYFRAPAEESRSADYSILGKQLCRRYIF